MRGFLPRSLFLRVFLFIIVLVVIVEFLMFSHMGKRKVGDYDTKHVREYEVILCRLELNVNLLEEDYPYEDEKPKPFCPTGGIVTAFKHWSLSQNMWIYANIIAFSVATTLKAYVPICLRDSLGQVFTNLSIPVLSTIGHCIIPIADSVGSLDSWDDISQSIVISEGELYSSIVMEYLDIARDEFTFKDALKNLARDFLIKARWNIGYDETATYVGVYITRTTTILNQEYDDLYPSVQFFFGAMNYFRNNYKKTVFIVVSDRADVWRSVFKAKDVVVVEEDSLKKDGAILSVLSHCNHTILSSGASAIWAAILAGGETVLSVSLSEDYNSVIKHYKEWIYLTNDSKVDKIDTISFT